MSYHVCTGSPFPASYHSPLTEKCDSTKKTTDIVFIGFSLLVYLVFGLLVVYETVKRKVNDRQSRERPSNTSTSGESTTARTGVTSRLQILVDSWPLLFRLIFCVSGMEIVYRFSEEAIPEELVEFPRIWFVYLYYFIYLQLFRALERYYQIMGHKLLRNHLKRRFRQYYFVRNIMN